MVEKNHFTESKAKTSAALGASINVYGSQGLPVYTFSSANLVAKYFNCSHTTILRYASNGNTFKEKWILCATLR